MSSLKYKILWRFVFSLLFYHGLQHHLLAQVSQWRLLLRDFFEIIFPRLTNIYFFHCLAPAIHLPHASSPAISLFPMPQAHASSPAHAQAHASSPCQAPASSPCLKPIPLFPSHLSPPCLKSSRPYFPFFALILRYLFHLISLYWPLDFLKLTLILSYITLFRPYFVLFTFKFP